MLTNPLSPKLCESDTLIHVKKKSVPMKKKYCHLITKKFTVKSMIPRVKGIIYFK